MLPSSYDPSTDLTSELPVPEASPSLYTKKRLQQSLVYAERCLERWDISPRSELFMQLYKEEIKDALKAETMEQRQSHAKMIMAEERLIHEKGFLRPLRSAQIAELEDQLLKLREHQYLVRYGDQMKIVPTRLRLHASKSKSENWQSISGSQYWSRIAANLGTEEAARKEAVRTGVGLDKIKLPTFSAVYTACADIGISDEIALWSINEYGSRNKVHRDLDDLKRKGEFPMLASVLCADRNELSSTFSSIKSETDLTHLQAIIQIEIETWFDYTSGFPNQPSTWQPSAALRLFFEDAVQRAGKLSKDEIKQANIAKSQRKSEEKAARQKEASEGTSSSAGKKRIASTEEPRGLEQERQERTRQLRFKLLARKCQLENEMKSMNRELALLDENSVSLDEQDSIF